MSSNLPSLDPSFALHVDGLSCTYESSRGPVAALRDVSFSLAPGERLAIVGESGAGKSTLLRCLNLLVKPTAGSVEVGGRRLTSLDRRALDVARRDIGMVFQHFALMHRRTVRENIALPLELAGVPPRSIAPRVDELLSLVRLEPEAEAYPAELSGGQRQRVGIARALAHAPSVLLCDEPTSALDVATSRHIVTLLDELSTTLKLTIVVVTHQLAVVRGLADVVAVLDGGVLRELTPVAELLTRPRSDAGRRLVSSEFSMKTNDDARVHDGVGESTVLAFAVTANGVTSAIFQTFSRHTSLRIDMVGANIETIRGTPVGSLTLLVHGDPTALHTALTAFEQQAIPVEVVGHVSAAS